MKLMKQKRIRLVYDYFVFVKVVYNVFEYGFIWIHKDITELFGRLIYSIKIL